MATATTTTTTTETTEKIAGGAKAPTIEEQLTARYAAPAETTDDGCLGLARSAQVRLYSLSARASRRQERMLLVAEQAEGPVALADADRFEASAVRYARVAASAATTLLKLDRR